MNSSSTSVNPPDLNLIKESGQSGAEQLNSHHSFSTNNQLVRPLRSESANATTAVAVFILAQIKPEARLWGYWRFIRNQFPNRITPKPRLLKHLGCGHQGGFGLRPSIDRQGLCLFFNSSEEATKFLDTSPLLAAYRQNSLEYCQMQLAAYWAKGSWSGFSIPTGNRTESLPLPKIDHRIATLTRASIRPYKATAFWRDAHPAHQQIESADGVELACGIGEAPIFRQATLTIWKNDEALQAYARQGAHAAAIRNFYAKDYSSESMFVRFRVLSLQGRYKGRSYE